MAEPARVSASGRAGTRRAAPRPQHGNTTQNQAIALGKEQAAEVRARENEMGMVTPAPQDEEPFDYSDDAEHARAEAEEVASQAIEVIDIGGLKIEALPREQPRQHLRAVSADGTEDEDELIEVRFNDTYEDVTLGKDPETEIIRMITFEENRRYRLPRWMVRHLADKEMLV